MNNDIVSYYKNNHIILMALIMSISALAYYLFISRNFSELSSRLIVTLLFITLIQYVASNYGYEPYMYPLLIVIIACEIFGWIYKVVTHFRQ